MADSSVNTQSPKMQTNYPENGVITIGSDTDVIMVTSEKDEADMQPPTSAIREEIMISDDEGKATNLEEIHISDDDQDEIVEDAPDDGDIAEENNPPQDELSTNVDSEEKRIEISFSSPELLKKYGQQFKAFLHIFKDFTLLENSNQLLLTTDSTLKGWVVVNYSDNEKSEEELEQNGTKRRRRERKHKEKKEDRLFVLDTEPSDKVTHSPIYRSKYKVIEDNPPGDDPVKEEGRRSGITCFNCSGEHTLRDCPLPKDMRKIKLAKQKFSKLVRYHEESDNKYNNLQPGMLSDTLKKALGLRRFDIPAHVYKMRVMGYPPGWLEEAKVFQSNLALFDSDGKMDTSSQVNEGYRIAPEKIIDYPGFNCKPERGCKDDCNFYGVPPYSSALSKENMIEFMNKMHAEQQSRSTPPRPKSPPSPSLNDLEIQKRKLLEQLTSNDDSSTPIPVDETTEDETELLLDSTAVDLDKTLDTTTSRLAGPPCTPSTPSAIASVAGTPIIKALSPYARLPNLDNFQKDVSPVINFENLPNATGKYEQLNSVLEKVRSTLKSRFQT